MSEDLYKNKYFSCLDDIEKKTKEWDETDNFLRKTISTILISFETETPSLNEKLKAFREVIRKKSTSNDDLAKQMAEISKELLKLDEQKDLTLPYSHSFINKLVEGLSISDEMKKEAKKLFKLTEKKVEAEQDKLLTEFNNFFTQCLKITEAQAKKNTANVQGGSGGFLDKLLGGGKKENTGQTTQENSSQHSQEPSIDPKIELSMMQTVNNIIECFIDSLDYPLAQKNAIKSKLTEGQPPKQIHHLLAHLAQILREQNVDLEIDSSSEIEPHTLLIHLLESIPLSGSLKIEANRLKENLAKGIRANKIPEVLDAIAKLIVQMQQEGQKNNREFEKFLQSMDQRLKEIDQFIGDDLQEHKSAWESGNKLSQSMKQDVTDIGSCVDSATSLDNLGSVIQSKVTTIVNRIEDYQKVEKHRVKRIQQQNQSLKERIKVLESESAELNKKVVSSQEKAYKDPLTGLPNRLSYEQHLADEFARWQRYHENLVFVIWDIDFFKKVNDNYGHHAGDEVLAKVAEVIRSNVRETDFVARFGGEEFVGLMPNTALGGGLKSAEAVRAAIEELQFEYKGTPIPLTISCGLSLFGDNDTPESVFERADKALYQAKEQGRNRCTVLQSTSTTATD